jgi:hypothetical protein
VVGGLEHRRRGGRAGLRSALAVVEFAHADGEGQEAVVLEHVAFFEALAVVGGGHDDLDGSAEVQHRSGEGLVDAVVEAGDADRRLAVLEFGQQHAQGGVDVDHGGAVDVSMSGDGDSHRKRPLSVRPVFRPDPRRSAAVPGCFRAIRGTAV